MPGGVRAGPAGHGGVPSACKLPEEELTPKLSAREPGTTLDSEERPPAATVREGPVGRTEPPGKCRPGLLCPEARGVGHHSGKPVPPGLKRQEGASLSLKGHGAGRGVLGRWGGGHLEQLAGGGGSLPLGVDLLAAIAFHLHALGPLDVEGDFLGREEGSAPLCSERQIPGRTRAQRGPPAAGSLQRAGLGRGQAAISTLKTFSRSACRSGPGPTPAAPSADGRTLLAPLTRP